MGFLACGEKRRYFESRYTIGGRTENKHTYVGGSLNGTGGRHYYRHRVYHAQLGRFCSRDPMGYEAGDNSQYRYVRGNPAAYADPWGMHIYLTKGQAGRWDLVGLIHQDVCVDTWDYDLANECCTHTGIRCFSFGIDPDNPGWRYWPGNKFWLGWSRLSTWASRIPSILPRPGRLFPPEDRTGHIYESSFSFDPNRIEDSIKTDCIEDAQWLNYILTRRLGLTDRYTPTELNCVNYTNNEYADAKAWFGSR